MSLVLHVLVSPFNTQARLEAEFIILRHPFNGERDAHTGSNAAVFGYWKGFVARARVTEGCEDRQTVPVLSLLARPA